MRKKIAAGAILALALGLAPLAAHAGDGDCPPPAQEQDQTIPASMLPAGDQNDLYLDQETTGIWQESNGLEGLQTAPYTCEETTTPADTLQAPPAAPAPEVPELPVP